MSIKDWRDMTPGDWRLFVEGWNETHGGDTVAAPTWDEFQELKAKYG